VSLTARVLVSTLGAVLLAGCTASRWDSAVRRAVALKPDWAAARGNLGYGLASAGRLDVPREPGR
jgi:hypothetical protein